MLSKFKNRWNEEAGYRRLLKVAFPLILSSGSISIMLFVDRMLLSWHSIENIAAVLPAGILNWALLCPFFGTVLYTSTFVAQYVGANRLERVGATIWHGIYIALIGAFLMPLLAPWADEIFAFIGHSEELQALEVTYFRILNFCSVFFLVNTVFSCFYSGRGRAWTIVWVNILLTLLNTFFDYVMIFGNFGFPEMGIEGAGWATMLSGGLTMLVYIALVMNKSNEAVYAVRSNFRFDKELFKRMLRFGFPGGMHFFLDVIGITVFMLLVGRIGTIEQAANNITHQIHLLGLLPLVGVGIATSILVGQFQGAGRSELAEKTTYSALHLSLGYNVCVSIMYLFFPYIFINPFLLGHASDVDPKLISLCKDLLKFVAVFTIFESFVVLSSATLKGAGDTKFVMKTLGITSISLMIIPSYIVIEVLKLPIQYAWICLIVNLSVVSTIFFLRFRSGKWKIIQVIEKQD